MRATSTRVLNVAGSFVASSERKSSGQFVAEGMQCAREALVSKNGPQIETLYLTVNGRIKVEGITDLSQFNTVDVSDVITASIAKASADLKIVPALPGSWTSEIYINLRAPFNETEFNSLFGI